MKKRIYFLFVHEFNTLKLTVIGIVLIPFVFVRFVLGFLCFCTNGETLRALLSNQEIFL